MCLSRRAGRQERAPKTPMTRKKRAAPAHLEAEAPKKGKGVPAVNTAWDVDSSPERRPRTKPQAASYVTWLAHVHIRPFLFIILT